MVREICESKGSHEFSLAGGDLSRVEGRSVKPYWTLLFSDILLFAKVSRDRVLFITEEPVPLIHISESMFNVRKKCRNLHLTYSLLDLCNKLSHLFAN